MKKTDWMADRESFRREWNAAARWNLKFRPNDEETHQNYDDLQKLAPPKNAERNQDDQHAGESEPKKRIHIRHKHKRVCPEHAQNEKQREETTTTTTAQENNTTMNKTNAKNNTNIPLIMSNRMIRQQPITYTLNQRADELVSLGLAKPPPMLLPGLHIPHVVGAGQCRMLTGGMPATNARHFERRPNRDYPDFSKCTVDVTAPSEESKKIMNQQSLLSTKRGLHSVNAQDVGGFGTAHRMPPTSMKDASECVSKNHSGGVHNTDQCSDDPLVLRQLHHAMSNRHRQYVAVVPPEVEIRAGATRQMIRDAVEREDDDDDDDGLNGDEKIAGKNRSLKNTLGNKVLMSKLPESNLIPKKSLITSQKQQQQSSTTRSVNDDGAEKNKNIAKNNSQKKQDQQLALQSMLLRIPVDTTAFRKKDEIKTHHESMHTVGGKVMMRGAKPV